MESINENKTVLDRDEFDRQVREQIYPLLVPKVKPVADAVRERFGIRPGGFTMQDFFGVCWAVGIELAEGLEYQFMADCRDVHGCLMRMPNGTALIYLRYFFDRYEPEPERTAAHELGHFFLQHKGMLLHKDGWSPDELKSYENVRSEIEADLFAELLCG